VLGSGLGFERFRVQGLCVEVWLTLLPHWRSGSRVAAGSVCKTKNLNNVSAHTRTQTRARRERERHTYEDRHRHAHQHNDTHIEKM
jgi:hypothetical protein